MAQMCTNRMAHRTYLVCYQIMSRSQKPERLACAHGAHTHSHSKECRENYKIKSVFEMYTDDSIPFVKYLFWYFFFFFEKKFSALFARVCGSMLSDGVLISVFFLPLEMRVNKMYISSENKNLLNVVNVPSIRPFVFFRHIFFSFFSSPEASFFSFLCLSVSVIIQIRTRTHNSKRKTQSSALSSSESCGHHHICRPNTLCMNSKVCVRAREENR